MAANKKPKKAPKVNNPNVKGNYMKEYDSSKTKNSKNPMWPLKKKTLSK